MFGLIGAVVAPLAVAVERWLPVVTVGMGLLLVAVGLATLAGRGVGLPGLVPSGLGPTQRWVSQVGYGVGFALVSLSCTVAPFLAVTATALRAGSVPGVVLTVLVYAVGMGSVVLALCLAVALARFSVTSWLRRCSPVIGRAGGALLVLAGLYVAWYGGYELRVLAGRASQDPLVAARLNSSISRSSRVVGGPPHSSQSRLSRALSPPSPTTGASTSGGTPPGDGARLAQRVMPAA